jgi:hypothetical protein
MAAKCQAMTWIDGRSGLVPGVIAEACEALDQMEAAGGDP